MSDLAVNISIGLIKVGVFVLDLVTYPIHAVIQQPWKKQKLMDRPRAKRIPSTDGISYRSLLAPSPLQVELQRHNITTVEKAIEYACKKYADKQSLGTRQILSEFSEPQPNGKVFKKYDMGDYTWLSYNDVNERATSFGRGLRCLGHEPKENMVVFAETRAEWLLTAIGAFKQNVPLCTLYATLGEDAIIHGINETEVRLVVTSHELLPKFQSILSKCPKVCRVIYFPDQLHKTDTSGYPQTKFYNFYDVIEMGRNSHYENDTDNPPTPADAAIIMYTSGSTGVPKGVVISHFNLANSMTAYAALLLPAPTDVFMAYLPLAHVLELMGEMMMMLAGIPMGYSSPLTMTDRSSKVKRGCKGDASVLKPTFIPAVPLILDRIYKGILDKVAAQGPFLQALFNFGVEYKKKWSAKGWATPFCDWFVFRKIRALLGSNVRMMATGGAPLSPDTHNFIRVALGIPVLQGYGLTETCACASLMDLEDSSTGRVGGPLNICDYKLVDWEEGNYRITDKPNPRGEIVIGGNNIAVGYYKNPKKNAEEFYEIDGKRWFRTGDIGEIDPDGVLKIIDRKKDLVKLQFGEYVSLGKVETELKVCPLVENICIYGDSTKNNVVGIVSPDPKGIQDIGKCLNKLNTASVEALCCDDEVKQRILQELVTVGKKAKLEKFELPADIHLTSELWTPDTGLVTAAFKLKRKEIQRKYQEFINRMYA